MLDSAPPVTRSRSPLRGLRTALAFLTRIPVGRMSAADAVDLGAGAGWFPVVGLGIGALCAAVRYGAGKIMPANAATVLAIGAAVLVTGALHEDGLADCADAIGARGGPEQRLQVLRDPRVGTFGIMALALVLLFSYAALEPLSPLHFARAVVVGHVLARCSPLWQSRLAAPARDEGLGASFQASVPALAVACAITIAAALGIGQVVPGATALALAAILTVAGAFLARRALGGTTGDTFGGVAKLVEVASYGAFAAFLR